MNEFLLLWLPQKKNVRFVEVSLHLKLSGGVSHLQFTPCLPSHGARIGFSLQTTLVLRTPLDKRTLCYSRRRQFLSAKPVQTEGRHRHCGSTERAWQGASIQDSFLMSAGSRLMEQMREEDWGIRGLWACVSWAVQWLQVYIIILLKAHVVYMYAVYF